MLATEARMPVHRPLQVNQVGKQGEAFTSPGLHATLPAAPVFFTHAFVRRQSCPIENKPTMGYLSSGPIEQHIMFL